MKIYWRLIFFVLLFNGCAIAPKYPAGTSLKNCPKAVTAIIDSKAENNLKSQNVSVKDILEAANKIFADNLLDFRYEIGSLEIIKSEYFEEEEKKLHRKDWPLQELTRKDSLLKKLVRENLPIKEDILNKKKVVLFFTDEWPLFAGKAYSMSALYDRYPNIIIGNTYDARGLILLITKFGSKSFNDKYLKVISSILVHEQSHLYGLDHVNKKNSFMYYSTEYHLSSGIKFDRRSKHRLQEELKNDYKCLKTATK